MRRTFCDLCGVEITKDTDLSVFAEMRGYHNGELITMGLKIDAEKPNAYGPRSTTTLDDICRHCVIDTVMKQDKRPKPAPPLALADATEDQLRARLDTMAGPSAPPLDVPRPLRD